jgi:hypothetical protein
MYSVLEKRNIFKKVLDKVFEKVVISEGLRNKAGKRLCGLAGL